MTAKRIEEWWIACDAPGCGKPYESRGKLFRAQEGWKPAQFNGHGWTTIEGNMREAAAKGGTSTQILARVDASARHYCPDHPPEATT